MDKLYKEKNEVSFSNALSIKILKYIKESHISYTEFANRIQITDRALYDILHDKSEPTLDTLRNIARELNVGYDDLLDFEFKEIK